MPFDPSGSGLDLIMGIGAAVTLISLARSWRSFVDDDFTVADRHLATQIAVFLVPPAVVLLHELGHAAAAVAVGGRVAGFHYGLFEGSVSVEGFLSPAANWFIALAGNLVSAIVGLVMLAAGRRHGLRRSVRYVLLFGGVFEIVFALVGYPVLSQSTRFGDWLAIYDFSATPGLSWATAVVHAAVLAGLWRWWRGDLRHQLFAVSSGQENRLTALRSAVHAAPADVDARLALANLYAGSGELGLAATTLEEAPAGTPGSARLHLARARLELHRGRWNSALVASTAGLDALDTLGRDDAVHQRLWANQGVALTQMGRHSLALAAFDHLDAGTAADLRVRYCRGVARLATGDTQGGTSDLRSVVDALPPGDLLRRWAEARMAGREPDPPDDSDRPAWQRRTSAPPAPVAGL